MPRRYVFADEAGDKEFARKPNVSRYFIVCMIRAESCQIGNDLLDLRRQLLWEKAPLRQYFHCSSDKQAIRDRVFALIQGMDIRIYAQILEKSKAQPHVAKDFARFYQFGWYYLLKFNADAIVQEGIELMVTAASIGTGKAQHAFTEAVNDAVQQTIPRKQWITHFCQASSDPCLQIADYCTWALQRKWESGGKDTRSYDLIADKIKYEYDFWAHGDKHYY